jgi:hypothetical protein
VAFSSDTAKSGYHAIGEDYINTAQVKANRVLISTLFQRIELEITSFDGEFERTEFGTPGTPVAGTEGTGS